MADLLLDIHLFPFHLLEFLSDLLHTWLRVACCRLESMCSWGNSASIAYLWRKRSFSGLKISVTSFCRHLSLELLDGIQSGLPAHSGSLLVELNRLLPVARTKQKPERVRILLQL